MARTDHRFTTHPAGKWRKPAFAATLIGISLAAGCSDDSGPTGPSGSVFPQTIRGTVTGASPVCRDYFGEFEAPCQQSQVIAPRGRTLVVRLSWSDPNTYLRLGSGASASIVNWDPCSASGCVVAFSTKYRGES